MPRFFRNAARAIAPIGLRVIAAAISVITMIGNILMAPLVLAAMILSEYGQGEEFA